MCPQTAPLRKKVGLEQEKRVTETDSSSLLEILVVEDSESHCELIRRAFANSAMTVALSFCGSVAEARKRLQSSPPGVVLADMRLPDGLGKELLEVSGKRMPLVLMTSFGDETQAVATIKAGALDYVVKSESSFSELPAVCWRASRDWRVQQAAIATRRRLEASEERYRTLFENVPAGIFQCDAAGRLMAVNPAMTKLLGYSADAELLGMDFFEKIVVADPSRPSPLAQVYTAGRPTSSELRLRRKDGREVIALTSIKSLQRDDAVCCYEGFIFDLTGQRKADAALAESRLRLEAAFHHIFGFMVLADEDGRVLDVSESAFKATGCERKDVHGKFLWDAPWWADIAGEAEAVKAGIGSARAGERHLDRARFRSADGSIRLGDRSFSPVFDENGALRLIVVEGRDITDLVKASRDLEESEHQFRNLFESASEALVVYATDTDSFVDLNRNTEKLFGAEKEQLLSLNALDLSPRVQPNGGLSAELARAYMRRAIAGEAPQFEWTFNNLSGESIVCEVRLNRVRDSRRVLIRGSIVDIRKRKRAEAKLRESQQRMSALVENANAGILELDLDDRVISANPAAVAIHGHNDFSEILGEKYLNYVPRGERSEIRRSLDLAREGHSSSVVYPVGAGSGQRMVATSMVAIADNSGVINRVMLMSDDITLRHASSKRLQAEREFTDAVVNNLPGAFFLMSEDGEILRFNDQLVASAGYAPEEISSMRPLDVFDSKDRPIVAAKIREVFERGQASVETKLITKNGDYLPVAFNGRLLEQDGKRFLVGFGIDISERRRNERRFHAEKRFSDTVINSMPGIFYVVDDNRKVVRWNENLLNLLGKTAEEMSTLDPMSVVAEADREIVAEGLQRVFEHGDARVEANFMLADGQMRPFILTGVRLRAEEKDFMVGMGFDISERRRYEAQLRASENYLRSIIESEPECVWTLDRKGRLIDINPAGRLMLGDKLIEQARADSIINLVQAEQREAFAQLNKSVFAGHSGILTFEIETEGGIVRWLETHAVALRDEKGQISGHLAVTRDITEKRNAEKKVRSYSDRLQKLSRRLLDVQEMERRNLARELHDEVGQSLTALKLNLGSGTGARAGAAVDSLQIIDRVLEQVRDLSLNLRPAILDDLGLLPALRWFVDNQARRGQLRARLTADSLTGVRLHSDLETAAFRIIQEALTNVLRHARATEVEIDVEVDDDLLKLSVRDNGAGFDPRQQIRRASRGQSFGLVSVKERATLLGGSAQIKAAPGEGALVSAWLPLKQQDYPEEASSGNVKPPTRRAAT